MCVFSTLHPDISQALIANNTVQTERWDAIETAFGELLELQQAQADAVQVGWLVRRPPVGHLVASAGGRGGVTEHF